jgi:hypothetical protein
MQVGVVVMLSACTLAGSFSHDRPLSPAECHSLHGAQRADEVGLIAFGSAAGLALIGLVALSGVASAGNGGGSPGPSTGEVFTYAGPPAAVALLYGLSYASGNSAEETCQRDSRGASPSVDVGDTDRPRDIGWFCMSSSSHPEASGCVRSFAACDDLWAGIPIDERSGCTRADVAYCFEWHGALTCTPDIASCQERSSVHELGCEPRR